MCYAAKLRLGLPLPMLLAGFAFADQCTAAAIAKGCGDLSTLVADKILIKPVLLLTFLMVAPDQSPVPIPINAATTGMVGAAADASNFFLSVHDGDGPRSGVILTPGTPPVAGSVATRAVKASVSGAISHSQAVMSGSIVPGDNPGSILGAVATPSLTCDANAVFGIADSACTAGTDPITLSPLPASMSARIDVDLAANFPSDPNAAFGLYTFASDNMSFAAATTTLTVTSNIPGLETLFTLSFSSNSASNQINVNFSSPLIGAPISATDFSTPDSVPGLYVLDPSRRSFSVPFVIPAGVLSSDGSSGLMLDILADGSALAEAGIPEPSSFVLFVTGIIGIGVLRYPTKVVLMKVLRHRTVSGFRFLQRCRGLH